MENELIEGLTPQEWEYLKTPLKDMNQDQRMTAMAIKDKLVRMIWSENDDIRAAQKIADAAKLKKAGEENAARIDSDRIDDQGNSSQEPSVAVA